MQPIECQIKINSIRYLNVIKSQMFWCGLFINNTLQSIQIIFFLSSHNERRTQWEDPRLQIMGISPRPVEHSGHLPPHNLSQPPYNPGGLGPHPHMGHQPMAHYHPHQMRHINNQSLDMTGSESDNRHLHPLMSHQYSQSYGGPSMHRPMASHPASMSGHFGHGHMGLHPQLQPKRSYDLAMMDHTGASVPVTLQSDPYLSEHARQASHDSGLGYPYQGDQGIMEFDEGFEGGLHTIAPMGSNQGLRQDQNLQGPANHHNLMEHLQSTGELEHQAPMDFGNDMLGEFGGGHTNHLFGSSSAWV